MFRMTSPIEGSARPLPPGRLYAFGLPEARASGTTRIHIRAVLGTHAIEGTMGRWYRCQGRQWDWIHRRRPHHRWLSKQSATHPKSHKHLPGCANPSLLQLILPRLLLRGQAPHPSPVRGLACLPGFVLLMLKQTELAQAQGERTQHSPRRDLTDRLSR
jgi:hypothetical protein